FVPGQGADRERRRVRLRERARGRPQGAVGNGEGLLGQLDVASERAFTGTFCTLPAFRQDVQTRMRLGEPFTKARTRWMLGFQRRLVRRCEWLIDIPKEGCLPHTSQTAGIRRRYRGN